MPDSDRLQRFVAELGALLDRDPPRSERLREAACLLAGLVAHDDWLPDAFALPHPQHYQQYRLHVDAAGRFSVVSFVWGPGQRTPIHDHTVWGLIGMLRGSEVSQRYRLRADGVPQADGPAARLEPGDVEILEPEEGDIHQVSNAFADRVSVSVHVYGADIGTVSRSVFTEEGVRKPFVSGYANDRLPANPGTPPGARP